MNWFTNLWNYLFGHHSTPTTNTSGTVPVTTTNTTTTVVTNVTAPVTTTSTNTNTNTEAPIMSTTGKRYAILAGSNFVGTQNQLEGCINDLKDVREIIEPTGVIILADLRDKQMTTANWKAALQKAASIAVAGDVIGHFHSHHGAQIKDYNDPDGLAEIYCPDDFDWSTEHMITDKWMAALLKTLKPGVVWLDWADCCHAGDSLKAFWDKDERPKYIPNPELEGIKFKSVSGPMVVSGADRNGILLAACRSGQTSSDCRMGGRPCGAFTNAMISSVNNLPNGNYEEMMIRATQLLSLNGFEQRPEIDAKPGDEKRFFAKDILGK